MTAVEEYRALYQRWAHAARVATALEFEVRAAHCRLLADAEAPAGKGVDVWGDGAIKDKDDCAPAPEPL